MPQRNNSVPPKPKMTPVRMVIFVVAAVCLDLLKVGCDFLGVIGPALAGTALGKAIAGQIGAAVAGAAAAAGGAVIGVDEVFEGFGTILADLINVLGWLLLGAAFIVIGVNVFRGLRTFGPLVADWVAGMIPFVNALPTFTIGVLAIIAQARMEDLQARRRFEAEQARLATARARQRAAAAQLAAAQAAAAQAQQAANDDQEIPESLPAAA